MKNAIMQVSFGMLIFMLSAQSLFASETKEKPAENSKAIERSELEIQHDTLLYGLDNEVSVLIDKFIKDKDSSFSTEVLNIFWRSKNSALREKIITYFIEFHDMRLQDYVLELLQDPYDTKTSTVNLAMYYAEKLNIKEAAPLLRSILETENQDYFASAISAIGTLGGAEEAVFLTEYLDTDLSLPQKQALVRALGKLKAADTWDSLVKMAENEDENTFIRMYAAEAIGNINKEKSLDILSKLYASPDPNLRQYVIRGLAENTAEAARKTLLEALKDDHYKVRTEAVLAVKNQKITEASPYLLYRAKNDTQVSVRYLCYEGLLALDSNEGIDYLISLLKTQKTADTAKVKIAAVFLENADTRGNDALRSLALESLKDDKKKALRYALGKEFAKNKSDAFESVCAGYLSHKDAPTKGTGLDIFRTNPYPGLLSAVQAIADDEKAGALRTKAKFILEH